MYLGGSCRWARCGRAPATSLGCGFGVDSLAALVLGVRSMHTAIVARAIFDIAGPMLSLSVALRLTGNAALGVLSDSRLV